MKYDFSVDMLERSQCIITRLNSSVLLYMTCIEQGRTTMVQLGGSPIVIIVILIIIKHCFGKIYIYGIILSKVDPFCFIV